MEEVVVTGTSIRGVAPVGSNLISVGQDEIKASGAQTLQGALANVPALSGFGNVGQGQVANSYYQPTIHNLGASASNSTLVLIDGHRPPTGGTNHSHADPNIVPINMIERVEVLADGSSSIYGSDAVAGVVNFITRKRFDGLQLDAGGTYTDGAKGYNFGLLSGRSWEGGSAIFAFTHAKQPMLFNKDREFTNPDQRPRGGTNFLGFNCGPATIQPGGAGNIFTSATSGISVANTAANGLCSTWADSTRVSRDVRNNVMAKVSQNFGDDLTVNGEVLYGSRRSDGLGGAGTLTATAFAGGAQANPFYTNPVGYTGPATNQTVRYDFTELLGPSRSFNGSDSMYADISAQYRIGDNFVIDGLAIAGRDDSYSETTGVVNGSVATLALNGTTNTAGSLTAESVPGTGIAITGLPLTAANALDVWNPAGTNRTSAALRAALLDNSNTLRITATFQQYRISTNGALFSVPAGQVRIAVGAELFKTQWDEFVSRSNNTGRASLGSQTLDFKFYREVKSVFGELAVPLISSDMNVPLVKSFDVNASVRHDEYSDFGKTTNPKFAFNWDVVDGLRFRGNISSSFVAPGLDIVGNEFGAYATTGWNATTTNLVVPVASFPQLANLGIAGCTAASTSCNIASLQGITVTRGDPNAKAQKGSGWSLGFDYAPDYLPGFRSQVTLWNTEFEGGITAPNIGNAISSAALNRLLVFYPGGATQAQVDAATAGQPQRTTRPQRVDYIFFSDAGNFLNLYIRGVDASFEYTYRTEDKGDFTTGLTLTHFIKFDQAITGSPIYSVLNTTGNNTSFPSIADQARARVGWSKDGFSSTLYLNYVGSYKNWSGTTITPITRNADGNPSGGGDKVDANVTFDANVSYRFGAGSLIGDTETTLAIRNITDKKPPFYNSSTGYDAFSGNPTGRAFTLTVRKKFF